MVEIEKYECSSKLEARMREQELMIQHCVNLNTCKAFITEEERKKKKQEITNWEYLVGSRNLVIKYDENSYGRHYSKNYFKLYNKFKFFLLLI